MADEGVNYFPLRCALDEKFELLEAEYGLKGFAIVVKLFQRIYKEHGYYCEWSDDIALIFARQCGLSNIGGLGMKKSNVDFLGCADASSQPGRTKNLINQVVAASIRRGIFDSKLFDECSILTSRGIQRNFLNIVRNRKKVEIKKDYLLLSDAEIKGNVVIIGGSYVRNGESDVRTGQSKGKERKVYKTENARANEICRFEDFLSAYPKGGNRHLTGAAYADLITRGLETEDNLVACAANYAEACKMEETPDRYIKSAQNFLKDLTFERYLPGKYKKPAQQKPKNRFNDFEQRGYDYAALERQLLGKQGDKGRR